VLHGLSLSEGELVALTGPSGSGKSTLLNIVGLLDRPTSGSVVINGAETTGLPDAALTALRGHTIGFVFQYHYLISAFTAAENVMMPMLVDKGRLSDAMQTRAYGLLLSEPLRTLDVISDGPNRYRVPYSYAQTGKARCKGEALGTTERVDGLNLVAGIKSLKGC
jgi:predicted ABC-type transport system involved in lysophospholipase L1 biosynthesis ATPase subunit